MALPRDSVAALFILLLVAGGWYDLQGVATDAAMFPRLILGAMGILAVAMFTGGLRRAAPGTPFVEHARNLAITVGLTAVYILAVEPVGYFPATFVFVAILAMALGLRRPVLVLASSAAFTGAVWLVFVAAFSRRLPPGFLFDN
jgi:putative tricarboxylic transport membrane protein